MFSISASSSDAASSSGADDRRDRLEPGELRRPPAALAGDQLVGAARAAGARGWAAARRGPPASRRARRRPSSSNAAAAGAGSARRARRAAARSSGAARPRAPVGVVRIAARPRPMPRGRSATRSHLLGQLEVRVRRRRSAGRGGSPGARSSAPRPSRTLRGITVSKTSDGKCVRTSRSTSWASFVRASCIVSSIPATVRRGLSSRWMSASVSSSPARPSSAKYSVCTGTITRSAATSALTVSGPERGRAVQQDVGEPLAHGRERLPQARLGARQRAAAPSSPPARSGVEARSRSLGTRGRAHRLLGRHVAAQDVVERRAPSRRRAPSPTVALPWGSTSTSSVS